MYVVLGGERQSKIARRTQVRCLGCWSLLYVSLDGITAGECTLVLSRVPAALMQQYRRPTELCKTLWPECRVHSEGLQTGPFKKWLLICSWVNNGFSDLTSLSVRPFLDVPATEWSRQRSDFTHRHEFPPPQMQREHLYSQNTKRETSPRFNPQWAATDCLLPLSFCSNPKGRAKKAQSSYIQ